MHAPPSTFPPAVLAGLPHILDAAREGSATQAARSSGTTTATVLRRIEAAEAALGVRLFERMPTGLEPTPALARALPWMERVAESLHGLQRDLAGLDPRPHGIVRMATPPTVASHLLAPHLPALRVRYPDLSLELDTAVSLVDLGRREADLAVRVQRPTHGDFVSVRLGEYVLVPVCAPALAEHYREQKQAMPWLTWERHADQVFESQWLSRHLPDAPIAMRASGLHTLLEAARAGVGVVLAPEPVAALAGGLVRVSLGPDEPPTASAWLVCHRALRQVPRVAAVWAWTVEVFQDLAGREDLRLPRAW